MAGAPSKEPDWAKDWELGIETERPAEQPERPATPPPQDANARIDANVNRLANRGSNGSLFVGEKGYITTGTYGEGTRLLPVEKMQDYKYPAEMLDALAGALSRLDSCR